MSDRTVLTGVIHGKTIQLEEAPGFPDGQQVTVVLRPKAEQLAPGEGIRRSFGGWADDTDGLDDFLEWNRQQRKLGRRDLSS